MLCKVCSISFSSLKAGTTIEMITSQPNPLTSVLPIRTSFDVRAVTLVDLCEAELAFRQLVFSVSTKPAVSVAITEIDSHPDHQPGDQTDPRGQRQKEHLAKTDDCPCNGNKRNPGSAKLPFQIGSRFPQDDYA